MSRSRVRALVGIAGIAAAALTAGLVVGSRLQSPADAAAKTAPPAATDITVPVELRVLRNQVVTRGDAASAEAVAVGLELGELPTKPVVTGQVPKVGAQLTEGTVLLEVVGRPVVVLAGELPMYRSLRPGLSGPDVRQLKQTLRRLGLNPGPIDDDYTAATARAVAALYRRVGYPPPAPAVDQPDGGDAAGVGDGPGGEAAQSPPGPEATPLPATEVVYLKTLPRRIDEVKIARGGVVNGPVMTVSGADLEVTAKVDDADRALLDTGMAATIELPEGGGTATGKVARIQKAEDGQHIVAIKPEGLTPERVAALRGANVRVIIAVESTNGAVLAVPLAALTAGPGGESRIQVDRRGRLVLVEVQVGLTAAGYAEVSPVAGELGKGDWVVVGKR